MVRHSLILGMPSRPRSGRRGRTAELTVVWLVVRRPRGGAARPARAALATAVVTELSAALSMAESGSPTALGASAIVTGRVDCGACGCHNQYCPWILFIDTSASLASREMGTLSVRIPEGSELLSGDSVNLKSTTQ